MLTYMEQSAIYNSINFGNCATDGPNNTALNTVIASFLCPSDGNASKSTNWNSYSGSLGTTASPNPQMSTGLFSNSACYGLRDIIDGSSNTVAFAEHLVGNPGKLNYPGNGVNNSSPAGVYPDAWANPGQVATDLAACNASFLGGSNITTNNGQWWMLGSESYTLFTTIVPPNSTQYKWGSCRNGCGGCSPDSSQYANSNSNHTGGCNVLMGDGSVKFIKSSVSQNIWWGLGTRANGEVIGSDAY